MREYEIKEIQEYLKYLVPDEIKKRYLDISGSRIQFGYNIFTSYRAGGKTTNQLLFCLRAYCEYGYTTCYCRTSKRSTTQKMISTMCATINNTVLDDGRNYVQHISNNKYVKIAYHARSKSFRLLKSIDEDEKTADLWLYIFSIDESTNLKSGFSDNLADIIIYDEFVDMDYNNNSTILFLNFISTIFRLRYNSICFMNCNLSVGNPLLFKHFGIYEKVLNQTTSFMQYKTKKGTKIFVNILNIEEDEEADSERLKMNERYFGFDIEGIDNITGMSITRELFRTLPDNSKLYPTNFYIHSCGSYYRIYQAQIQNFQNMYYVQQCCEPEHLHHTLTITDDKISAFEKPYTYYNRGELFELAKDFYRKMILNDVCYENFMTYVSIKSFYQYFS